MTDAKKTERPRFAWQYGQQAKKDGRSRDVPEFWQEHAEAWLKGYDGETDPTKA